ncbi:hypothetical protein A7985_25325 [Pseudoalteromonas luteoviolacea]|uniref:Uncharacterized protein n=1 Tax=Pseudoalteromonas luteoviolacea TaxID=43657 RepID=A0A1C0TJ06_9GAMM|nr:hypothetical protein A7985_25325 [Pseudoalteromonas luteoviolacea]
MNIEVVYLILTIALSLDLISCYYSIKRLKNKKGASSIPFLTFITVLILYVVFVESYVLSFGLDLTIYFIIHVLLLLFIPLIFRRIIKNIGDPHSNLKK